MNVSMTSAASFVAAARAEAFLPEVAGAVPSSSSAAAAAAALEGDAAAVDADAGADAAAAAFL